MVEQRIRNAKVGSSSLLSGTNGFKGCDAKASRPFPISDIALLRRRAHRGIHRGTPSAAASFAVSMRRHASVHVRAANSHGRIRLAPCHALFAPRRRSRMRSPNESPTAVGTNHAPSVQNREPAHLPAVDRALPTRQARRDAHGRRRRRQRATGRSIGRSLQSRGRQSRARDSLLPDIAAAAECARAARRTLPARELAALSSKLVRSLDAGRSAARAGSTRRGSSTTIMTIRVGMTDSRLSAANAILRCWCCR